MAHGRSVVLRRWAAAVVVYLLAVFHRTSLGVAGLQAAERFHIDPGQLSIFVLLQLGVYAAMQIPTGMLVDRYGPRRLLLAAAMTMAVAQAIFALAHSYPLALLARGLLGFGDALTFVSVLRFAAAQFSPRRYPLVVAITGMLGSLGNLVATVPLSLLLHGWGWTTTFLIAAVASVLSGSLVFAALPAMPSMRTHPRESMIWGQAVRGVGHRLSTAWSLPGTRAGFWVHFTSMSTMVMFTVLWGVPFMIEGQGLSRGQASAILLVSVVAGLVASPGVGFVTARYRAIRVPLAIGCAVVTVSGWAIVLSVFTGPIPHALLVGMAIVTGVGGPISAIGFSVARDYNGPSIVGTATGVVNVAGFVAGITASLIFGQTLQHAHSTDRSAYRVAFGVALVVQLFGLVQTVRWWLRARDVSLRLQERGASVPVPLTRHRWDLR